MYVQEELMEDRLNLWMQEEEKVREEVKRHSSTLPAEFLDGKMMDEGNKESANKNYKDRFAEDTQAREKMEEINYLFADVLKIKLYHEW